MKTLSILLFFIFLSGCTTNGISKEDCYKACKKPPVSTQFEGISFARLNSQEVVLVEQIKDTKVIQASTKNTKVELTEIMKRPLRSTKKLRKAQFGGGQSGGAGAVFGQSEDSILLIKPAGGKPVLVCGETQNPCAIGEDASTHGGCGPEFGDLQDDDDIGDYYQENAEQIGEYCENEGSEA